MENASERTDLKSWGRQHLYNKRKHNKLNKDSKTQSLDETLQVAKPKWESNTWRYERSEGEIEENVSTNYEFLVQAPISEGGHFQFKSDKLLDKVNEHEYSFFALDLNLLGKGLETIPFFKRCNLNETLFDENELNAMRIQATKTEELYESYLENKIKKDIPRHDTVQNRMDNLEFKVKKSNINKEKEMTNTTNNTNVDLEQWLDDILED